jgi:hypothetical protein
LWFEKKYFIISIFSLFGIVVMVAIQSAFRLEIYQDAVFSFFKNYF